VLCELGSRQWQDPGRADPHHQKLALDQKAEASVFVTLKQST